MRDKTLDAIIYAAEEANMKPGPPRRQWHVFIEKLKEIREKAPDEEASEDEPE